MSVQYRVRDMIPLVDPAEVRGVFLAGGYRALERRYSPDNEVVQMLIAHAGGDDLRRERAAMQVTGRKCGGRRHV